jgi:hypothetical protein
VIASLIDASRAGSAPDLPAPPVDAGARVAA